MALAIEDVKVKCILCEVPYSCTDLEDGFCPNCKREIPPESDGPGPTNEELNTALGTEGGYDADCNSQL